MLYKDFMKEMSGVALTANEYPGIMDMYRREGFCEYVSKPVSAIKLYEVLMANLPGTALE